MSHERHHRLPRSRGGSNEERNISLVETKYHRAYHLLFGNMTPLEMASLLNDVWIDPDVKFVVRRRKKRAQGNPDQNPYRRLQNPWVLERRHLPKLRKGKPRLQRDQDWRSIVLQLHLLRSTKGEATCLSVYCTHATTAAAISTSVKNTASLLLMPGFDTTTMTTASTA